jgi:hypothetical protein
MPIVKPNRVKHRYTQSLVAPRSKGFPLLCPELEKEWVPGWDPELIISNSGVAEQDCVFVTSTESDKSIWVITRHDTDNYAVEMVKVTPEHTVGKLTIQLLEDEGDRSKAEIAYEYTSLGPDGDAFLESFTADWYEQFMIDWEKAINHYLLTGRKIS